MFDVEIFSLLTVMRVSVIFVALAAPRSMIDYQYWNL